MIRYQFFPRSRGVTHEIQKVIDCFKVIECDIDSTTNNLVSNDVLAMVRPFLEEHGYMVEMGKTSDKKYELGAAESIIERLTKHQVELNPKLLSIVFDSLFSLNVTTEEIAEHTGLPENLIDDAREMRYNDMHAPDRNLGDTKF